MLHRHPGRNIINPGDPRSRTPRRHPRSLLPVLQNQPAQTLHPTIQRLPPRRVRHRPPHNPQNPPPPPHHPPTPRHPLLPHHVLHLTTHPLLRRNLHHPEPFLLHLIHPPSLLLHRRMYPLHHRTHQTHTPTLHHTLLQTKPHPLPRELLLSQPLLPSFLLRQEPTRYPPPLHPALPLVPHSSLLLPSLPSK